MKKRPDEITNAYYKAIFRYCLQLLEQDIYAAEECTQEIFLLLCTENVNMVREVKKFDFFQKRKNEIKF